MQWLGKHLREFEKLSEIKNNNTTIFDFKKVYLAEKKYLTLEEIVYIISKNYFEQINSNIEVKHTCEKCFENNNVLLELKDFKFLQGSMDTTIQLKNGDIILEMQEPQYVENLEATLDKILISYNTNPKKQIGKILSTFYFNEFIYCVKSIIRNGETIHVSSMELEDILLNEISLKEYENVMKEFQKCKSCLIIEKTFNCDCCGAMQTIKLNEKEIPEEIKNYLSC